MRYVAILRSAANIFLVCLIIGALCFIAGTIEQHNGQAYPGVFFLSLVIFPAIPCAPILLGLTCVHLARQRLGGASAIVAALLVLAVGTLIYDIMRINTVDATVNGTPYSIALYIGLYFPTLIAILGTLIGLTKQPNTPMKLSCLAALLILGGLTLALVINPHVLPLG